MNKKIINILSPGRFHVLDLARELDKNGFDVKFYSFVPTKRAMSFGLPEHCSASLFYILLPFLALQKVFGKYKWIRQLRVVAQDFLTSLFMRKCDVLIAMSGDFVLSIQKAQKQGSLIIVERGSTHILEQKKILESIPSQKGKEPVPAFNVKRELKCYEMADYISIASLHVRDSFLKQGFSIDKLFMNPYGVDLSMFHPIENATKEYDVIMVGGWSYRKGCDLIAQVAAETNYKFLHVGSIVDLEIPALPNFTHVDSVNQKELINFYAKAKVFVLPSREEGLSMVQAQAIACGLPIVGSEFSGARDLQGMVECPEYVYIIKDYDWISLKKGIETALEMYSNQDKCLYAGNAVDTLTWSAYGKRYCQFINNLDKWI